MGLEIEHAVQNVVETFGTLPHTDKKSKMALEVLNNIEKSLKLSAGNPHEVNRCLDALFILETAKAIFLACGKRQENLGPFIKQFDKAHVDKKPAEAEIYGLCKKEGEYIFHMIKGN